MHNYITVLNCLHLACFIIIPILQPNKHIDQTFFAFGTCNATFQKILSCINVATRGGNLTMYIW